MYGFVAAVAVVVLTLLHRFLNSQFGSVLVAVRENESRAAALGYNIRRVKFISFVISGIITGLAGSLYTIYLGIASPNLLNFALSGELLFIIILGGAHTFFGPVVGTVIYFALEEGMRQFTDRWQFFVGLLFLLLVHFAPKGVLGSLRETGQRLFSGD
jgi:branched-chain amino acid transport system permease protein